MFIRKSENRDIESIMELIRDAQCYFKASGIDQWQDGYPTRQTIMDDIRNGWSHVLITDEGEIAASAAISFDGEVTYNTLQDGNWLQEGEYAVIHRLAVRSSLKGKGLGQKFIHYTAQICSDRGVDAIRVDTHADNRSMQRMLLKTGFSLTGKITLLSGAPRTAFEKILK